MKEINIQSGSITIQAVINESATAQKLWEALPIEGRANIWGDEIYFEIPIIMTPDKDARAEVEVGELGYWPLGHAFCIFFGPTPVSQGNKPRAYSPVNILGRVIGDTKPLKQIKSGEKVLLVRRSDNQ